MHYGQRVRIAPGFSSRASAFLAEGGLLLIQIGGIGGSQSRVLPAPRNRGGRATISARVKRILADCGRNGPAEPPDY